jgi:type I restriction enzyme S subunit
MNLTAWPRYGSYKDSGEGWIEHVPAHWEARKLKQLFQEKRHRSNLALNCGAISFGEVVEKDDERIPLATKASYQEVLKGEFLVNPLNLNYDLKSLRIGLSDINVVVSAGYIVLQAKGEMDKRYFKYLLHRYDVANMKLLGSGVRQTISFNHIANSILVTPPLPEQRAISAFLDYKCAKVGEAVRIKEEQITLLRERRQILIQQAVTRGLNPSAPMKDSGIDWIGQIPVHWSLDPVRANFLFRNEKNNPVKTEHILSLSIAHGVTPYSEEGRGGNKRKDDLSAYKLAYPGDIVLNSMNVIVGAVGLSKFFGAISPVYYALYAARSDVNVAFYDYIFSNMGFQKGLLRYGKGIMMKLSGTGQLNTIRMKISQDDLKNLPLPTPPIEEQVAIVDFISASSKKIEEGIAIKQEQIAALKEYKNSLINAAVTGKIKVGDHMEPSSR